MFGFCASNVIKLGFFDLSDLFSIVIEKTRISLSQLSNTEKDIGEYQYIFMR